MLKDRVGAYYLEKNYNCAETLIHAINDEYHLALGEEEMKLAGGFGGGMGCGLTCGALSAAIAALGKLFIGTKAHETAGFKELCADYVDAFRKREGAVDCSALQPKYFVPGVRCLQTVELAADLFDEFVKEHQLV